MEFPEIEDEKLRRKHVIKLPLGSRVQNIDDTSNLRCNCNGWLNHWKFYSRKDVMQCVVEGCDKSPSVGAHISAKPSLGGDYIAPFCYDHNHPTNTANMALKSGYPVVSADKTKLCKDPNVKIRKISKKIRNAVTPKK